MRNRVIHVVPLLLILTTAAVVQPTAGQTPVGSEFQVNTTTTGNQMRSQIAMDASGNFAVVWFSGVDINCQRYDSTGVRIGSQFRVNTNTTAGGKDYPAIDMNDSGDFVVAWQSYSQDETGTLGIFGQLFDNTGSAIGSEFQVNSYTTNDQAMPAVVLSPTGSFAVVWQSYGQDGNDWEIYGRCFDNTGAPTSPEFRVNSYINLAQTDPAIAMDSSGNFAVVWVSYGQDGSDEGVFRRRFNASGTPIDSETQISVFVSGNQSQPDVAMLPLGEHVVVWSDVWDGSGFGIYARRFDNTGTVVGPVIQVNTTTINSQQRGRVAYDSAQGFSVVWDGEMLGGDDLGIVAQRFLSDGVKYGSEYQVNTHTSSLQFEADIAIGGSHQAIVWTSDSQDGDLAGIFGQRYTIELAEGDLSLSSFSSPAEIIDAKLPVNMSFTIANTFLDVDSFRISVRASDNNTITVDDALLATVILPGLTAGNDTTLSLSPTIPSDAPRGDIYLGVLVDDLDQVSEFSETNNSGSNALSYQVPLIYSVKDVLGDQGGWVFLKWYASPLDAIPAGASITEYTLWRTIDIYGIASPAEGSYIAWEAGKAGQNAPAGSATLPTLRAQHTAIVTIFWELIDSHPAYYLEGYGRALPTLFDSTAVNTDYHYFQVMAHTSDPLVHYISSIDSARSVDDLAPCAPACVAGEQTTGPSGIRITWCPNSETDLDHYAVYRGATEDFVPGPANVVGPTCDTLLVDGEWRWDSGYVYKISAIDVHGNESLFAVLSSGNVTGVDSSVPVPYFLAQNHPNPFNPSTSIPFGLNKPTDVRLAVYDVTGRQVRLLLDSRRPKGLHHELWDARDDEGRAVASGVYFYRLAIGERTFTRKMNLIK